jgi:uncharacterized membrane protein
VPRLVPRLPRGRYREVVIGADQAWRLLPEGTYADIAEDVAGIIELVGVAILAIAGVVTALGALRNVIAGTPTYEQARRTFGRGLLLSLEVLVAADVVQTVAVDLTLESIATLGLLVLVRTVLSLSLSAELEGVVPWRRADLETRRLPPGAPDVTAGAATPPRPTAGPGAP